jgi:signal transduction histidine kinase
MSHGDHTQSLQEELKKRQEQTSKIGHDINNVLATLRINVELIKMNLDEHHDAHPFLKDAERAILQACNLSRELLSFNRQKSVLRRPVEFRDMFHTLERTFQDTFSIKTQCASNLHTFEADMEQIERVLANLLNHSKSRLNGNNILEVCAENSSVRNEEQLTDGEYVRITIRDFGSGLDDVKISKIFDTYGCGEDLSLPVSYSIIKNHNGHIKVDSSAKGTVFTIYLPASNHPTFGTI